MKTTDQYPMRTIFSVKIQLIVLILVLIPIGTTLAETPQKNSVNQELPTVSYIIPWKSPPMNKITGKPLESLTNKDVLQPLDREVFQRQLRYYNLFKDEYKNQSEIKP